MKVLSVIVITMILILAIYQMDSFISTHINHGQTVDKRQYYTFDNQMDLNNAITSKYVINCANLNQIQIKTEQIRRGQFKTTDVGIFNGQEVAVKYIFNEIVNRKQDSEFRQFLFMKEIFMLNQLDHPGLIKMLGYCVKPLQEKNIRYMSMSLSITAVYEYGEVFNVTTLSLSVEQRIKHVLDLADLLLYLEKSPLGSLRIDDFKSGHFLMVNNVIKLIDFDYFNNDEPTCKTKCPYNLTEESKQAMINELHPLSYQKIFFSYYTYQKPYYIFNPIYLITLYPVPCTLSIICVLSIFESFD